jgi:hypothetical protein
MAGGPDTGGGARGEVRVRKGGVAGGGGSQAVVRRRGAAGRGWWRRRQGGRKKKKFSRSVLGWKFECLCIFPEAT